jgi:phosphatidylserine/phosphatidylglycerophosphate/cardiolipin synthase-like enzyme
MDWLAHLTVRDLNELAAALESGRLSLPCSIIGLERVIGFSVAGPVATGLNALVNTGFQEMQAATLLRAIASDRQKNPALTDLVDLVTSGPDAPEVVNRDTGVVVREMFSQATRSVLVAGYAVHQGRRVFQALADRMEQNQNLKVRLFLDIQRQQGDTSIASELVLRFANKFREKQWPEDKPLPEVYYDPRSVAQNEGPTKACLHAKVVVVDDARVFISSANFTEAAQERNIEIGLLVNSQAIASQVRKYFDTLVSTNQVDQAVACSNRGD